MYNIDGQEIDKDTKDIKYFDEDGELVDNPAEFDGQLYDSNHDKVNFNADGNIDDITSLGNIANKYRVFGWNVCEFDGNDINTIKDYFDKLPPANSDIPTVFICHTIKGKGISFMENNVRWHAGKITEEQYKECIKELEYNFSC